MAHALDPSWKGQIPERSLKRGWAYACAGKVDHVDRVPKGWKVTVHGTTPYRVFVPDADFGTVGEKATCTCPWFDEGHLCKHIAAACFVLDGEEGPGDATASGSDSAAQQDSDQADLYPTCIPNG